MKEQTLSPKPLSKRMRVCLVIVSLLALRYFFFRAPSEGEMIAKFQQHKAEFEQIRLMLQQDQNVARIDSDWVRAEAGGHAGLPLNVSEDRLALYHSRLRALGFPAVRRNGDEIELEEFGGGLSETTWSIGYIWSARPLTPLVKSAYSTEPQVNQFYYSRLGGNWYLYHCKTN